MRLINTHTLLLEEFIGRNMPPYAILSHTWDEDEVTLQDMANPQCKSKKGFHKITATCQIALGDNLDYAWVDTCCIDKTSSAELSEAINSMYLWYQRCEVCYIYLSDLDPSSELGATLPKCRWFTRGWTLQELIAPDNAVFFDREWNQRGKKSSLIPELSLITGISEKVLNHAQNLSAISVAQKMSWSAHRATTRIEDTAYCLLGIFAVHMPLIYGEEDKAFRRLQQEIIRTTPDLSIFAWRLPPPPSSVQSDAQSLPPQRVYCGFLAESPLAFSQSGSIMKGPFGSQHEFSMSNCGIKAYIQTWSYTAPLVCKPSYLLPVDCSWDQGLLLGVGMKKCGPDQFLREDPWNLVAIDCMGFLSSNPPLKRYLLTDLSGITMDSNRQMIDSAFFLSRVRTHVLQLEESGSIESYEVWPRARWDDQDRVFFLSGDPLQDSSFITLGIWPNTAQFGVSLPRKTMFKAICFVIGWLSRPQVTVVSYDEHPMIDDILARIRLGGYNSRQILNQLRFSGIQKAAEAAFPLPETDLYIRVFSTLSLRDNPEICARKFWSLHISSQICGAKDLRHDNNGEWIFTASKV